MDLRTSLLYVTKPSGLISEDDINICALFFWHFRVFLPNAYPILIEQLNCDYSSQSNTDTYSLPK